MSKCSYCAWGGGLHDPHCPDNKETHSFISDFSDSNSSEGEWVVKWKPEEKKLWHEGWNDGRQGRDPQRDEPVYRLGYTRGQVALEEYENGYDPVWMN